MRKQQNRPIYNNEVLKDAQYPKQEKHLLEHKGGGFFFSVPLFTLVGSEIKLAGSDFFRSHFPRQLWSSSKRSYAALTSMLSKLQLVTEAGPWSLISLALLLCVEIKKWSLLFFNQWLFKSTKNNCLLSLITIQRRKDKRLIPDNFKLHFKSNYAEDTVLLINKP